MAKRDNSRRVTRGADRRVEQGIYARSLASGGVSYVIRVQEGGRQRRLKFDTLEEARAARSERAAVPASTRNELRPNRPVDEPLLLAVLEHLRRREPPLAESTINGYRKTATYHLAAWAKQHRWTAAGVTFDQLEAFCNARQVGGNAAFTNATKFCLVLGRSLVEMGFRIDNPAVNPANTAKRLDAKPLRVSARTIRTRAALRRERESAVWLPTRDEVEAIITKVPGRLHQLWFWTLAYTGLRPSEAAGLRWERDLLVHRHVIVPNEPLVEQAGHRYVLGVHLNDPAAKEKIAARRIVVETDPTQRSGKNTRSRREVTITPQLEPILDELEAEYQVELPDTAGGETASWVFPGRQTTKATASVFGSFPLSYDHAEKLFAAAAKKATGLDLRQYDLRHLFASDLRRRGVSYATLARQLGNSEAVCQRVYQHVLEGEQDDIRALFA